MGLLNHEPDVGCTNFSGITSCGSSQLGCAFLNDLTLDGKIKLVRDKGNCLESNISLLKPAIVLDSTR